MPHARKDTTPIAVDAPPIEFRFAELDGYTVGFETFKVDADPAEFFKGLPDDRCQCPHWGFVLHGQLTTTDAGGVRETVNANDLLYWPPGHNVKVDADAKIIMFSPQREHSHVINHMIEKVKG